MRETLSHSSLLNRGINWSTTTWITSRSVPNQGGGNNNVPVAQEVTALEQAEQGEVAMRPREGFFRSLTLPDERIQIRQASS